MTPVTPFTSLGLFGVGLVLTMVGLVAFLHPNTRKGLATLALLVRLAGMVVALPLVVLVKLAVAGLDAGYHAVAGLVVRAAHH